MARRLPPLNALRAFEAAARHLSFTRAAAELSVTQAAISHQVKALEERLGVKLFRRLSRGLVLTEAGQRFLPPVREAFDMLAAATERVVADDRAGTVTITVLPSFAAKWLVPRLLHFRAQHPDIEVRIIADDQLVDFSRDDVDLGIRYGRGDWDGLEIERLATEDVFPVCSPRLLEGVHPLRAPDDLRHHTLLHEDRLGFDWQTWLMAAGVEGVDVARGLEFSHASMALQAAIDAQGVALGRTPLVDDDLRDGRLVKPFDISLANDWAYYVVGPPGAWVRPKVAAVRDWLLAEARAEELVAA